MKLGYEALDAKKNGCDSHTAVKVAFEFSSLAQDLVYKVTAGKNWTPKHIGLGSTVHQSTRSKELVRLLRNAGNSISYEHILQVDNALAESTLKSMNMANRAVVPPNLVSNRFVHFTFDNIDINDSTLDGINIFHATQVAAWQCGPALDMMLQCLKLLNENTTRVPAVAEELIPARIGESIVKPKSTSNR